MEFIQNPTFWVLFVGVLFSSIMKGKFAVRSNQQSRNKMLAFSLVTFCFYIASVFLITIEGTIALLIAGIVAGPISANMHRKRMDDK